MAWSTSFVSSAWLVDMATAAHSYNLSSDTQKLALYNNTGAYTVDATIGNQEYNTGAWSGNEVSGTNWAAGGVTLSTTAITNITGVSGEVNYSAANISAISNVTLAAFYGCIIYDTTALAAGPIIVAIYFGGAYQVSAGSFAITWGTDGHSNSSIFYIVT